MQSPQNDHSHHARQEENNYEGIHDTVGKEKRQTFNQLIQVSGHGLQYAPHVQLKSEEQL